MFKLTKKKIQTFAYIVFLLLLSLYLLLLLVGFRPYTIISASMSPSCNIGDIVYVKKTEIDHIHVGDIVTYKVLDTTITHRVVEVDNGYLMTKGDNNDTVDLHHVNLDNLVGKVYFKIPYIGYISLFIANLPRWLVATSLIVLIILLLPKHKGDESYEQ